MIPPGQTYRPEGTLDPRSIIAATILGVSAAVLAAFVVWVWQLSPIPTLVIVTSLAQGLVVALTFFFLIGRLKLRQPKLIATVAFFCGLGSAGLTHYAHYLRSLDELGTALRAEVEADQNLNPAEKQALIARVPGQTRQIADQILIQKTGHGGLLGSILLRAEQGVMHDHRKVTGWELLAVWGFEAFLVAGIATEASYRRASAPFCEECGTWCTKAVAPVTMAGESASTFAEAIQTDDQATAGRLLDQPSDLATIEHDFARTTLHSCDSCDQTFVDVDRCVTTVKRKKAQTKTKSLIKKVRISPAMLSLVRGPVVVPGVSPPRENPEHHVIDEPAPLEGRDL